MRDGFIKVAAGAPKIRVGDCHHNAEAVFTLMREAAEQGVRVLVLPELCLTGATCGDLFFQSTLLKGAEEGLATVLAATRNLDMLTVVGLPLRDHFTGALYNCAVLIHRGAVLGVVPATNLTRAQKRWFSTLPAGEDRTVSLLGATQTASVRGVFRCSTLPELVIGVEVGEAPFAPVSPSAALAVENGATLILCPPPTGTMPPGPTIAAP
jgi:NAD+ synthase (glutamine-hydrolysing)